MGQQITTFNWQTPVVGSLAQASFVFQNDDGSLYNITGATWEYVVRIGPSDRSAAPLLSITTTSTSAGVLVVTTSTSTVALTINPAGTASLKPGIYSHTLWMNPNTTTAYAWLTGQFTLNAAAQA